MLFSVPLAQICISEVLVSASLKSLNPQPMVFFVYVVPVFVDARVGLHSKLLSEYMYSSVAVTVDRGTDTGWSVIYAYTA